MSMLTRGRSRFAALGTAGALAASALVFAAPSAQAAEPSAGPTLQWNISAQFISHFTFAIPGGGAQMGTITTDDDAVFADGDITFTKGLGSYDVNDGSAEVRYQGRVHGNFNNLYSVTIEDPTVTVDDNGNGTISAVVSSQDTGAATQTGPARTVVTTFDAESWSPEAQAPATQVATPKFAGVLPADSAAAQALGLPAGQPIDGAAFAPEFLAALVPTTRAHFYKSGSASGDPRKAPAEFTAQAYGLNAGVTSASYADGIVVRATGTGYADVTNGLYVAIAPSGGLPEGADREEGMKALAGITAMVPVETDGTFSTAVVAPTDQLVTGSTYSVYTWQAHTLWDDGLLYAETPITIDWNALTPPVVTPPVTPPAPAKVAPKLTLKVTKAPTTRKAGRAVLTVKGSKGAATGKVKVQVLKGKKVVKKFRTASLKKGKLTIALPKRAKGTYKVKVTYAGNASYKAASTAKAFKIRKR